MGSGVKPRRSTKQQSRRYPTPPKFAAKFPGACSLCDDPIEVGQMIQWWDSTAATGSGKRVAHVACVKDRR